MILLLSLSFVSAQVTDVDTAGASSCAVISQNLRYLTRDANGSNDVAILQDFLNSHGYLKSQPTGFFGAVTRRAVIAFQNDNGLRATPPGFVGAGTRAKIQEIDCKDANSSTDTTAPIAATSTLPIVQIPVSDISFKLLSPTDGKPLIAGQNYNICWNSGKDNKDQTLSFGVSSTIAQKGDGGFYLGTASLSQGCFNFTLPIALSSGSYLITANNQSATLYSNSPTFTVQGVSTVITIPPVVLDPTFGTTTLNGQSGTSSGQATMCSFELRLCPDGSRMPRDNDCTWRKDKCALSSFTTTSNQSVESSLEVIEAPKISLQYDSLGKESMLEGKVTVKITAGDNGLDYNLTNGVPSILYFFGTYHGISSTKSFRLTNSGSGSQESGPQHLAPGTSQTYSISITAPTRELYADTYFASLVGNLYNTSGVVISNTSYKGTLQSNTIAILGETNPGQMSNTPVQPKNVSVALCTATIPVLIEEGIGDGCSTNYKGFNLATIPQIGAFRSTFTPACNNHDRCYTTLGYSTSKCNSDFLSDMKSACKSKYNRLLRPVEYAACNQTALEYKAAVDLFVSKADPGPSFQDELVSLNRKVQNNMSSGVCMTTPERTNIYSQEIIDQINSIFLAQAGRKPDANEFFSVINLYYSPQNYTLNTQGITDYARNESWLKIPNGEVVLNGATLSIKNPLQGAVYVWRINGYPESVGDHMDIPTELTPMYDTSTELKGYVNVTLNGFSNKIIVDTVLHIIGECGKKTTNPCIFR
jgi:hypothetical protein